MIRFKKNVDTEAGFVQIGTIKTLSEFLEREYVRKGIADYFEFQKVEVKEEKAEFETKELKFEPETKRRGRKPKE